MTEELIVTTTELKNVGDINNVLSNLCDFDKEVKIAQEKAEKALRLANRAKNIEVHWWGRKVKAIEQLQEYACASSETMASFFKALTYSQQLMEALAVFSQKVLAICIADIALIDTVIENIKNYNNRSDVSGQFKANLKKMIDQLNEKKSQILTEEILKAQLLECKTKVKEIESQSQKDCNELKEAYAKLRKDYENIPPVKENNFNKMVIVLLCLVVIVIIGIVAFLLLKNDNNQPITTMPVAETSNSSVNHDNNDGNSLEVDTPEITDGNGVMHLSYGTYKGEIKDGYPDGIGSLTYSKERVINKNDSKKRVAKEGERVEGEFAKGFLVTGKHYDANGELIQTLMIGVSPNDEFEEK